MGVYERDGELWITLEDDVTPSKVRSLVRLAQDYVRATPAHHVLISVSWQELADTVRVRLGRAVAEHQGRIVVAGGRVRPSRTYHREPPQERRRPGP